MGCKKFLLIIFRGSSPGWEPDFVLCSPSVKCLSSVPAGPGYVSCDPLKRAQAVAVSSASLKHTRRPVLLILLTSERQLAF